MPYLNAVCNESLRLDAPLAGTQRHAATATLLNGVPISKGQAVTIPIWAINRSTALWGDDAARFNPDRWLNGPNAAHGGAQSSYAMLTFLYGPRSCIGSGFAKLEVKCLLAAFVSRFSFEKSAVEQTADISGFITTKPRGGLPLKLRDLRGDDGLVERPARG
jgi:cytochrome P450